MTNLKFLDIRGNELTGTLPELSEESPMYRIWLSFNLLTVSIPESWYKETIDHINVWFNMISGPISQKIADCKDLTYGDFGKLHSFMYRVFIARNACFISPRLFGRILTLFVAWL